MSLENPVLDRCLSQSHMPVILVDGCMTLMYFRIFFNKDFPIDYIKKKKKKNAGESGVVGSAVFRASC